MFGKHGINSLMKQAQKMQEKMNDIQKEVSQTECTGESGAGLVKVTLNGSYNCIKIKLDPKLLKEEQELIEDLVVAAINDAVRRIKLVQKEKMSNVSDIMHFPFNLNINS